MQNSNRFSFISIVCDLYFNIKQSNSTSGQHLLIGAVTCSPYVSICNFLQNAQKEPCQSLILIYDM